MVRRAEAVLELGLFLMALSALRTVTNPQAVDVV